VDIPLPSGELTDEVIQEAIGSAYSLHDGHVIVKPKPGLLDTKNDIMVGVRNGRLRALDLRQIVANADLVVHAAPGTILVNKDSGAQNLVIGAPFALRIPVNQTAHVDGMVAYCIDVSRHTPQPGTRLDVLGRAGDLGGDALNALQRVVDVVAAREPGPLLATPGANDAIWRVSDDQQVGDDDPDAQAILAAAGIPAGQVSVSFAAPHFDDPDPASPDSEQLTPAGAVVPPVPVVTPTPAPAAVVSRLVVTPRNPRHGRVVLIGARVGVSGADGRVAVDLVRHGTRVAHAVAPTRRRRRLRGVRRPPAAAG